MFPVAAISLLAVLTNCRDLAEAVYERWATGEVFDVTAICVKSEDSQVYIQDGSGAMRIEYQGKKSRERVETVGDRIRVRGLTVPGISTPRVHTDFYSLEVVERGGPPPVCEVDGQELTSGRHDFRHVRTTGEIVDVFPDEVDPRSTYMLLDCHGARVFCPIPSDSGLLTNGVVRQGVTLEITGFCEPAPFYDRMQLGRVITADSGGVRVISGPARDPFAVPDLGRLIRVQPEDISRMGRHRADGLVLAVWGGSRMLIRRPSGKIVEVEVCDGGMPEVGTGVEVVGLPETDLYNVSLSRARWRPAGPDAKGVPPGEASAPEVDLVSMFRDVGGLVDFKSRLHGRRIRVRGKVCSRPLESASGHRLYIEDRGVVMPVDPGCLPAAFDGIEIGTEIAATGVCVMEAEKWRSNASFENIRGFFLVLTEDRGIRILSRPPWWTPGRLLGLIGVLLVVIAVLFARNRVQARISALRFEERTHLAVELHDSLAQNLTGVSMEIESAIRSGADEAERSRHLSIADRTLKSCRNELRNTLWDLRNRALEEKDFAEAIRRTLQPHIRGVVCRVRCDIRRSRLNDNAAHDVLCVIRELVLNAIRHGKAGEVRVAGAVEPESGVLRFSVRDDGCGFDPDGCPGVLDGHFGLEGIRERLRAYRGTLVFEPGKDGVRAVVSFNLKGTV